MERRIAILGIIIEDIKQSEKVQSILHEYNEYILGRMGLPRVENDLFIITVVLNAPQDKISSLSGKLGNIEDITAKVIYSKNK
ncbi:iron-only hydrogenase system regulator [Peptoniphilus sp. KCTC 25270]|uniref:TM1266 family iron-only hydrogenase system putative regulator n=1 Tax=Peptoniphilus sp. KCTC 25270 TaxID=2897414 RepID=UPI001E61FC79|nr:TM1266 family iron-only hydrogenase system putative regulator [Peptoniphilus sp. KCTC 25270]MCD1147961.1 iron-only hydrogenase system regulator [Peptoniphilus sp. KCTC 25270]